MNEDFSDFFVCYSCSSTFENLILKIRKCLSISPGDNLGNQGNWMPVYFFERNFYSAVSAGNSIDLLNYILLDVTRIDICPINALHETFLLYYLNN